MTRQKNKVLTFFFSLIPGAGQMYLGFMKRGLSLILYVVLIGCTALILAMPELAILVPPVWMYAFFDAMNLNGCDEEYFREIKDDYITFDFIPDMKNLRFSQRTKKLWGKGMVMVGIFFLISNMLSVAVEFSFMVDLDELGILLRDILNYFPRLIISVVLIIMGKFLINGNSMKNDNEYNFRFIVEDHSQNDDEMKEETSQAVTVEYEDVTGEAVSGEISAEVCDEQ